MRGFWSAFLRICGCFSPDPGANLPGIARRLGVRAPSHDEWIVEIEGRLATQDLPIPFARLTQLVYA